MNKEKLRLVASGLEYPQTPDIAGQLIVRLRTPARSRFSFKALAWSLTLIVILCSSLMLLPPVRAAIIEFIQIGVVRIFPSPASPTVEPVATATPESFAPNTATPASDLPSLNSFLDKIAGETKLINAQQIASYPILLPTYPSNIGAPDHVYVQDVDGAMTVLVWLDRQQPEKVILSLHFIPSNSWVVSKFGPVVIRETQVDGRKAIWAEGPYPLKLRNGDIEITRLIEGHVLIWSDGDITYRLETDQGMEEAVKIAESLEPIK